MAGKDYTPKVYDRLIESSQSALLELIIDHFGGPAKLSRLVEARTEEEIHPQAFIAWRNRGYVPDLVIAVKLALTTDVLPEAFNYDKFTEFMCYARNGAVVPWRSVVSRTVKDLGYKSSVAKDILDYEDNSDPKLWKLHGTN